MMIFASLMVLMLLVVLYDATRYIIPNWLNALVLLLYPLHVILSPVPLDWQMALVAMGVMFAVGFVTYLLKWMGAGDVKLLAAVTPWIGWRPDLLDYTLYVALVGGALSLLLLLVRKIIPWVGKVPEHPYCRILHHNSPVPYGLAIAVVFLVFLFTGRIAGIE